MTHIGLWLVGAIAGSLLFWLAQTLTGGPTITKFMGQQIVAAGGYPAAWTTLIGWAVHLGVSLAYAALVAVLVAFLRRLPRAPALGIGLLAALTLGWMAALIAPPAISITISLLGRQGWPVELFPLNTELGLPLWNHLAFFTLNWLLQTAAIQNQWLAMPRVR
jgi:hypothetical protein